MSACQGFPMLVIEHLRNPVLKHENSLKPLPLAEVRAKQYSHTKEQFAFHEWLGQSCPNNVISKVGTDINSSRHECTFVKFKKRCRVWT